MEDVVNKIMQQPDAPRVLHSLSEKLRKEAIERRKFYNWVDEHTKAEFINGEIIIQSPVKMMHWKALDNLSTLLSVYVKFSELGYIGTEKVMIALERNDYEPDIVFFDKVKAAQFSEDQVLFPAPDFVVEILSKKTASIDKKIKKKDYAAHGIGEYWIVDPSKKTVTQYILSAEQTLYDEGKELTLNDTIESKMIRGFKIPIESIFDEKVNLSTLTDLIRNT
jgi:Uma2 family endonuclease